MRIWSLHPRYLDQKGLVALWRETLLAQAVLAGQTRGYRQHSQLVRFKACETPTAQVARYLLAVHDEAVRRGYRFDRQKIGALSGGATLPVTTGQLEYEWAHLQAKLQLRAPAWLEALGPVDLPQPHPLFHVVEGDVEGWEVLPLPRRLTV